jgi:hypothetical protein
MDRLFSLQFGPVPPPPTPRMPTHVRLRVERRYPIPSDFELAHARKYIMDNELYQDALNRFFEQRKLYPECAPRPSPAPPDSRS